MPCLPLFAGWLGVFSKLNALADLAKPSLGAALVLKLGEELPVGPDQGGGAVDDEGDLVIAIALAGEEDDARKGSEIVFDGTERVIKIVSDLVGL
jgi:hypothetical protein